MLRAIIAAILVVAAIAGCDRTPKRTEPFVIDTIEYTPGYGGWGGGTCPKTVLIATDGSRHVIPGVIATPPSGTLVILVDPPGLAFPPYLETVKHSE